MVNNLCSTDEITFSIFNSRNWLKFYNRLSSAKLHGLSIKYSGENYCVFRKSFLFVNLIWLPYTPPSDDFIHYLFKSYGLFTFVFYHNRSPLQFYKSTLIKRCSTFLVSLSNDLSSSFSKNWSRNLRRSSKLAETIQYQGPLPHSTLLDICKIYSETVSLKNLKSSFTPTDIISLNDCFGDKLVVSLVYQDSQLLSVRGALVFGSGALDILSATSNFGRKTYASHKVTASLLRHLFESYSVLYYDLNGVDQLNNPGVYNFKAGVGGSLVSSNIALSCNFSCLIRLYFRLLNAFKQIKFFS